MFQLIRIAMLAYGYNKYRKDPSGVLLSVSFAVFVFLPVVYFLDETITDPWSILYCLFIVASGLGMAKLTLWLTGTKTTMGKSDLLFIAFMAYLGLWVGYVIFCWSGFSVEVWGEPYLSLVLCRSFIGCYTVAVLRLLRLKVLEYTERKTG